MTWIAQLGDNFKQLVSTVDNQSGELEFHKCMATNETNDSRQLNPEVLRAGKKKRRLPKRSIGRKRKYAMLRDWYAMVLRKEPDRILTIDRTLSRAHITVRMYYPEIYPRELAFRALSQDEFLQIIERANAPERSQIQIGGETV